jgi:hypothetical protein
MILLSGFTQSAVFAAFLMAAIPVFVVYGVLVFLGKKVRYLRNIFFSSDNSVVDYVGLFIISIIIVFGILYVRNSWMGNGILE